MKNILSANQIKIIGHTKSTSSTTGSLTTNGGIGCVNLFCDKSIITESLAVTKDVCVQDNLNINGNINTRGNILSNGKNTIGEDENRFDNVFSKNLDVSDNITLGTDSDNNPLLEITEKVIINSDIELLNKNDILLKTDKNNINIYGNININNAVKLIGNNRIDIQNDLFVKEIIVNNLIKIKPKYITIDCFDFLLDVDASLYIINLKIETNITFKSEHDNVLAKLIFVNYGSYKAHINCDNKCICVTDNCEIYIFTENKTKKYFVLK